jgi:predicted TIM-barrel fold metal-dependent hydrolase
MAACSGGSDFQAQPTQPAAVTESASATAHPTLAPSPVPTPTPVDAATLPIVDAHFHADLSWDIDALLRLMDNLGVAMAGSGGQSNLAGLRFVERDGARFFALAATDRIHALNLAEGGRSWRLESEATLREVERLERGLEAGCFDGIGEVLVNTLSSHRARQVRLPADSPLMQRLWSLSARYGVPLSVHMDAEPASVAEMERLISSDRAGVWLWAHSGWYATPSLLRRLLRDHPNLHLELSFRDSLRSFAPVDSGGRLRPEWKELMEEFPDRFLLGTDVLSPSAEEYRALVSIWRGVLRDLTPETAVKVAYENAGRILKLGSREGAGAEATRCLALGL